MPCPSTTHHTGCACHEARRDEEIADLNRRLDQMWCYVIKARGMLRGMRKTSDAEAILDMLSEVRR